MRAQSIVAEKGDGSGCCRFDDQTLMGHIVPTARKERAMDSAALPRSFLLLSPGPQPMELQHSHSGWVFLSKPLWERPEGCLLGDNEG